MATKSDHKILGKQTKKIIRIGNAQGISLPKDYLEAHGLDIGSHIDVYYDDVIKLVPISEDQIAEEIESGKGRRSSEQESRAESKEAD